MPIPSQSQKPEGAARADKVVNLAMYMLDKVCEKKMINRDPILVSTCLEIAEKILSQKGRCYGGC